MLVVDASVLVSSLVGPEPEGTWAAGVVRQGDLLAPELALAEATNTLRKLEMRGVVAPLQAESACHELTRLAVSLVPFGPCATRVWELRRNLTAYDAWYVAVAEGFGVPLATLDRRLVAAPGPTCKFLTP